MEIRTSFSLFQAYLVTIFLMILKSIQLHSFSDASENAYSGVVYLRMIDSLDNMHVSLVMLKTRVTPIKRISIPHLELCGAQVLTCLLTHVKEILQIPMSHVFVALLCLIGSQETL